MKKSSKFDERPSFQFYPKDWLSDLGLQACSYKTKGFWIDILCYMWFAPARGCVEIKNLQNVSKMPANEFKEVLQELIDNNVCEYVENKFILCRKMHRQYHYELYISKVRSEAGKYAKHQQNTHASSPSPSSSPKKDKEKKENNKEKKENPAKAGNPQADFVNGWKNLYQAKTGQVYKADSKDYILAAKLLKDFSAPVVLEKSKLLFDLCNAGQVWFAKSIADFSIGKLSKHWNEIIEEAKTVGNRKQCGINKSEFENFIQERE